MLAAFLDEALAVVLIDDAPERAMLPSDPAIVDHVSHGPGAATDPPCCLAE
jgi:hypothetical protein